MHWGVRRNANRPGGADGIPDAKEKKRGRIGKHLDSLKRERSWHKTLKDSHTMTTKDINTISKRIGLENSLKKMAKSKMATKKDKEDYLRRHEMSDQELTRKVNRLNAKDSLHKAVSEASKEQREIGYKVAQIGASVGVRYATNRRVSIPEIHDIIKKPKDSADDAQKTVVGKVSSTHPKYGPIAGDILNYAINKKLKPKPKK